MSNRVANTHNTTSYNIQLKHKNNTRIVNVASVLIILISVATALFKAVNTQNTLVIVCGCIKLIATLWCLARAFNNKPVFQLLNILLAVAALYWFVQANGLGILMGCTLGAAFWFEKILTRAHSATISATGVVLQTNFIKPFAWQQLANVIIKDGLLTIDAKNNKIYQKEATEDFTAQQEAEINEFCRLQLMA